MKRDLYIEYLEKHYRKFSTIDDIPYDAVIEYEGEILNFENFFNVIRTKHKYYIEKENKANCNSPLCLARYEALDGMHFNWIGKRARNRNNIYDEKPLRYLRWHYATYGTINDIDIKHIVNFEGEDLAIGLFLKRVRERHANYVEGIDLNSSFSDEYLARYSSLEKLGIIWGDRRSKTKEEVYQERAIKYLIKHYHEFGTINDIGSGKVVKFDGVSLNIGGYLSNARTLHNAYVISLKEKANISKTNLYRFEILDFLGIDWSPRINRRAYEKELVNNSYIAYLRDYYKEHGTINDIGLDKIVIYNGIRLDIGEFLTRSSLYHQALATGVKLYGSGTMKSRAINYALGSMNFNWDEHIIVPDIINFDPYIEYLEKYYEINGTINDIKTSRVATIYGIELNIGRFLEQMKMSYAKHLAFDTKFSTPLLIRRYEVLKRLDFDIENRGIKSIDEIASTYNISRRTLSDLKNLFDNDLEKTFKISLLLKREELKREHEKESLENITIGEVLYLFGISKDELLGILDRDVLRINKSLLISFDITMGLKDFCLNNGYNYGVISRSVKLKRTGLCDEDLTSLINRSIIENSTSKPNYSWIYSKYGNEDMLKLVIRLVGFDYEKVISDMGSSIISIEEAFCTRSFKMHKRSGLMYLEAIYHEYASFYNNLDMGKRAITDAGILQEKENELKSKYFLNDEEISVIKDSLDHYINAIYTYRLCEVAFASNMEERLAKINQYKFTDEDIENAYLMPLNFNKKSIIGRTSSLYGRRSLIRGLTLAWAGYTADEQSSISAKNKLTKEELSYINDTSIQLDRTKKLVKEN